MKGGDPIFSKIFISFSFVLTSTILSAQVFERPKKDQTLASLSFSISAILVLKGRLVYLPYDAPEIYESPFQLDKKTGKVRFFESLRSKRIRLDQKKIRYTDWAGISQYKEDFILIDGFELKIYLLDKDYKFFRRNDIAWDLILPPRDRLGEATSFEVKKLRKRFSLEMRTAPDKRLRGIVYKGENDSEVEFFSGTSLKSFPVVVMSCMKDDLSRCRISRNCRVPNFQTIHPMDRGGIAFDPKSSKLFMIDKKRTIIRAAKYKSCVHSPALESMGFDPKMKPIDSIGVGEGKIWIGLSQRDDYYNNSIFTYDLP